MIKSIKKIWGLIKEAIVLMAKDLWAGKFVIIIILAGAKISKLLIGAMCPLVIASGLPCAGCGMTRAATSILKLHFDKAFAYNPSIFVWIIYVVYLGFYRYIKKTKIKRFFLVSLIVFSITLAVYICRMLFIFPSEAPMTYFYNNLFAKIIPGYNQFIRGFWKI